MMILGSFFIFVFLYCFVMLVRYCRSFLVDLWFILKVVIEFVVSFLLDLCKEKYISETFVIARDCRIYVEFIRLFVVCIF